MRNTRDRVRHAIIFEIIGLVLVTPLGAWAFGMPMVDIGVVALVGMGIGATWNYVYNLLFDLALVKLVGDVRKSVVIRVVHAILFEIGFLIISVPFIAWYLQITLLHALMLDVSFSVFFMLYAFVYNWAYDLIFPVPHSHASK